MNSPPKYLLTQPKNPPCDGLIFSSSLYDGEELDHVLVDISDPLQAPDKANEDQGIKNTFPHRHHPFQRKEDKARGCRHLQNQI